jgi:glucosylceramidase
VRLAVLSTAIVSVVALGLGPVRSAVVEATADVGTDIRVADTSPARPTAPTIWQTRPGEPTEPTEPAGGLSAGGAPDRTIVITTAAATGSWRGVGGALTDAAVVLLTAHPAGVDALFAEPADGGAGLDLVRLPLSSTDFSTERWTWAWDPTTGAARPGSRAVAALDVLATIDALRPGVSVIAASWTAPEHMRTAPTTAGGNLLDRAVTEYGAMLAAQAAWLVERGVQLDAVSLGNEPGHVAADAPTLGMTDGQMSALSHIVGPQLDGLGVDLLALDHNWSDADRARNLLADGAFDGVGFHCYDGDASLAIVPRDQLVTECTATTGDWLSSVGWMARELVEAPIAAGSTGLMMWNLALDPDHGPKAPGGCEDCRGLITIDPATGTVERSPELAVLTHLSLAAEVGAAVIPTPSTPGLPVVAFANPDGSVGVFIHNDSDRAIAVELVVDGEASTITVDAWSLASTRL